MDIEGAEMLILENTNTVFDKLVYEWSFDIDSSLPRFWSIIEKQMQEYSIKYEKHRTCHYYKREMFWQKSWFPACTNVFCYKK